MNDSVERIDYAAAFAHGAPGIAVAYSVDAAGVLTIAAWGGAGDPPTTEQVEAWAAAAKVIATNAATNETTLRERLEGLLAEIEIGAPQVGVAGGPLPFASLTNPERAYLRRVARANVALIRLQLRALDATGE